MRGSKLISRQRNAFGDVGQRSYSFGNIDDLSFPTKKTTSGDLAFRNNLENIFQNQWEAQFLSNSTDRLRNSKSSKENMCGPKCWMRRACCKEVSTETHRSAGTGGTGCSISTRVVMALVPKGDVLAEKSESTISRDLSSDSFSSSKRADHLRMQLIVVSGGHAIAPSPDHLSSANHSLRHLPPPIFRGRSRSDESLCTWDAPVAASSPGRPLRASASHPASFLAPLLCRHLEPAARAPPLRPASRAASDAPPTQRSRPPSSLWGSRPAPLLSPPTAGWGRTGPHPPPDFEPADFDFGVEPRAGAGARAMWSAPAGRPAAAAVADGRRLAPKSAGGRASAADARRFRSMVNPLVARHPHFSARGDMAGGGGGGRPRRAPSAGLGGAVERAAGGAGG